MFTWNKIKFIIFQMFAVILYIDILRSPVFIVKIGDPQLAILNFLFQIGIMIALSFLLAPKPKLPRRPKPISLEQFDIPTAEEGRPIQVLFGKKYITAPNVVWYGHLRSQEITG